MMSHAPPGYDCPICRIVADDYGANVLTRRSDIVARTEAVTAFVGSHWWPNNPGHVIVVSNRHFENIFDLPLELATQIHALAREVAIAMKQVYGCDGISTRQHNEPAGNQEIWHYHLHVFPRYHGDNLYGSVRRQTTAEEREPYAARLREYLAHRSSPRER